MGYQLRQFTVNTTYYQSALALRTKVLRKPLGLVFTAQELEKDIDDVHFGLFDNQTAVACLTLTETADGRMKMRQVAVDDSLQGKGLGRELSKAAEEYARQKGFSTIFCHARKVAAPFYSSMGYNIAGPEFTEVNIPHYLMEKSLV